MVAWEQLYNKLVVPNSTALFRDGLLLLVLSWTCPRGCWRRVSVYTNTSPSHCCHDNTDCADGYICIGCGKQLWHRLHPATDCALCKCHVSELWELLYMLLHRPEPQRRRRRLSICRNWGLLYYGAVPIAQWVTHGDLLYPGWTHCAFRCDLPGTRSAVAVVLFCIYLGVLWLLWILWLRFRLRMPLHLLEAKGEDKRDGCPRASPK